MGLTANPDFQSWLARYIEGYEQMHGDGPQAPPGLCDGCGDALPQPPAPIPFCIVCLAEQYGRDRAQAAARIATALRLAMLAEPDVPTTDIREAVEEVLGV